jgi:hypothetical protein
MKRFFPVVLALLGLFSVQGYAQTYRYAWYDSTGTTELVGGNANLTAVQGTDVNVKLYLLQTSGTLLSPGNFGLIGAEARVNYASNLNEPVGVLRILNAASVPRNIGAAPNSWSDNFNTLQTYNNGVIISPTNYTNADEVRWTNGVADPTTDALFTDNLGRILLSDVKLRASLVGNATVVASQFPNALQENFYTGDLNNLVAFDSLFQNNTASFQIQVTPVPEPMCVLVACGLGLASLRFRKFLLFA